MSEATNAATVYKRGLNYIAAGRRIAAVSKRLDNGDARQARNLSDRLMDKGLKILAGVMKPAKGSPPSAEN